VRGIYCFPTRRHIPFAKVKCNALHTKSFQSHEQLHFPVKQKIVHETNPLKLELVTCILNRMHRSGAWSAILIAQLLVIVAS
jgi:hypothetical protein